MRRTLVIASLLIFVGTGAFGQKAAAPAFEVASVKVSEPLPGGMFRVTMGGAGTAVKTDPGRIHYPGITLKTLISRAYGVWDYQVEGPDWIDSERYDVTATMAPETTKEELQLMLQGLLAERFKLTLQSRHQAAGGVCLECGQRRAEAAGSGAGERNARRRGAGRKPNSHRHSLDGGRARCAATRWRGDGGDENDDWHEPASDERQHDDDAVDQLAGEFPGPSGFGPDGIEGYVQD